MKIHLAGKLIARLASLNSFGLILKHGKYINTEATPFIPLFHAES
jgi:hypothetical protein